MKTQENDGTEIVPNAELQLIIKANALPDDLGNVIQEKFSGAFAQLDEWKTKADALVITSEDQVQEIALANDGRKTLMKIRTTLEKTRVELKAPYLNMGRAIDAVCKSLTERIAPIEEDLKTKAEYAVNLAAERKARLVAERRAALIEVGHSGDMPALGEMEESTFQMLLEGAKAQAQRVKEQQEREAAELAAAQEAERLEAERLQNREKVGQSRRLELVKLGATEEEREGIQDPDSLQYLPDITLIVLGNVWEDLVDLFDMDDSEWADCLQEFTNEAQRIADEEAARLALVDRTFKRKLQLIEIGLKAVNGDDYEYFEIGKRSIYVRTIESMDESSWENAVGEFQKEAQRIANEEAEKTARKDRFQSRVKTLIALGAKEITDAENDRLELGNSKVMLDALYDLNEEDERWTFTLQSFQDDAMRLKQIESDLAALAKRTMDRTKQLLQLGAVEGAGIDGEGYGLGTASASLDCIMEYGETEWQYVVDSFKEENQRLAELEAKKQQAQQERLQTANDRLAALRNVDFATTFDAVADLTDTEFDALLKVKTTEHNAQKERQRIANLGLMRKPLLDAQGEIRSAEFLGGLTNDEFQALLDNATRLKTQADQDRANEAAQAAIEAQRKADEAAKLKADEIARKKAESATDKEKLEEMVKQIQAIVMPTCTSIQGDAIARGAIERLGKLVGHMHEAMQQM